MSKVRVSLTFDLEYDCDEDEALERAKESFEDEWDNEDILVELETVK